MTRRFARSLKGDRAHGSAPINWERNISVIGAIRLDGIVTTLSIEGAADGEVFGCWVEQMLGPELRPGDIVVMDNLSAHKSARVKQAIRAAKALPIYLPPYSPDLSPIEPCWSKIKTYLRAKAARDRERLEEALAEAIALVTSQDARGWFSHCGYAV